jgi:hypothetical protein
MYLSKFWRDGAAERLEVPDRSVSILYDPDADEETP